MENNPEVKIEPQVFWINRDPLKSFQMKNRFLINEGFFMDTNRDPPNFLWRFFQWVFFGFRWEKL